MSDSEKTVNDLSGTFPRSRFSKNMRNVAAHRSAFVVCLALASFGCSRAEKTGADAHHYEVRGIIRAFSPNRETIEIEHEDIPGFMPSMTMPFTVKNPQESAAFRPGEAISFRLEVTEKEAWIDQLKKINATEVKLPAKPEPAPSVDRSPRLHAGDAMPPFELTNQNGQPVTLEAFHGRPFVLTFIFTRCPIPNFCPLMTRNFVELQKAIKNGEGSLRETGLLSISFDPEHDTPAVLKEQAQHEGADPSIWSYATGTPSQIKELTSGFSVLVQSEAGTISHSLATALIDANGRIVEIWRGNGWKPGEVLVKIPETKK